ncbi:hypothetical protein QYF36_016570 [Acer negundo]|nr:hypothetical protein QYF36_016570 [Acer negundo]
MTSDREMVLPQLETLTLQELASLVNFCAQFIFPSFSYLQAPQMGKEDEDMEQSPLETNREIYCQYSADLQKGEEYKVLFTLVQYLLLSLFHTCKLSASEMEIAVGIVSSILSKIGDYLLESTVNQVGYFIYFNSIVEDLRKQDEYLRLTQERVQQSIERATKNNEDVEKDVRKWLTARVCTGMWCQRQILLNVLNENEGLDLLKRHAIIGDEPSTLIDMAKDVVRECNGLPLAIATIGSLLREKTVDEWKVVTQKLKKSKLVDQDNINCTDVYACLS